MFKKVTGAEVGYAGILNLPKEVEIYIDESVNNRLNFECGANKTDYHSTNVNFGRDIPTPKEFYDIKNAKIGDLDPDTKEKYEVKKAAEVGNIFLFIPNLLTLSTTSLLTKMENKSQSIWGVMVLDLHGSWG